MADLQVLPAPSRTITTDALHCITQDPMEPVGPEFLAVCDDNPVDVITSTYCAKNAPECGGHPICGPCLALARERGLVDG
jgi:hypothetical protein